MVKFFGLAIIILIVGLVLTGLGKQIATALQAGKRLDTAAEAVDKLQQENRNLRDKLAQTQKIDFVEEVARDKLNMGKPGEAVIVVPDQIVNQVLGAQKKVEEIKLPNWQGWLKLFTH